MHIVWTILIALICLVGGAAVGYFVRKNLAEAKIKSAEEVVR